jgi:large subunit ribosomal protein L31
MKAGIHPVYKLAKVICACGNTFETRSAKEIIKLEICSACHPFYTGQQRLVDTAGRVERFKKRFVATQGQTVVKKVSKVPAAKKVQHVGTAASARKKVLSSAPTTAPAKKDEKPAKKAPKKAA